jgi:hypothetical protein
LDFTGTVKCNRFFAPQKSFWDELGVSANPQMSFPSYPHRWNPLWTLQITFAKSVEMAKNQIFRVRRGF